ncbi:hypothetical protein AgCh_004905 [Apium graveolens]
MNHKEHDHPWSFSFSDNHINYLDFSRDRKRSQDEVLDQSTSLQEINRSSSFAVIIKEARYLPDIHTFPGKELRDDSSARLSLTLVIWFGDEIIMY